MNFYDTKAGKCFFDVQLPKLIQVLEDLSVSLSRKQTAVTLPVKIPENYLEDLYYGNLKLGAYSDERYQNEGMKEIILAQEELEASLSPEQRELCRKYSMLLNRYNSEETCRMFQHGFKLAVNLLAAGLDTPKSE